MLVQCVSANVISGCFGETPNDGYMALLLVALRACTRGMHSHASWHPSGSTYTVPDAYIVACRRHSKFAWATTA
eukprot:13937546-Alexandrium_andersonii.AAC.1